MKLTMLHTVIIVVAVLITFVPGFIIARSIKNADDYNVGGRKNSAVMVCAAIMGTIVGGASTMGTAQLAFQMGLTAWWFTLGCGIAMLVMAAFYAHPLRYSGLTTISEFLVKNYGRQAGLIASISASVGMFFSVVASTLTGMNLCCSLFGMSPLSSGVLVILVVAGFVFWGGISGSGLAGAIKMFYIFLSIFVGGVFCYFWMGGLSGMHAVFPYYPWFSLFGKGTLAGWTTLAVVIIGTLSTQSYAQAVFSAKDNKAASLGCFMAAAITIPVGLPSILIGMYMKLHHPGINPIDALPMFLLTYLPPWLGGIGITALILASIGGIAGIALGIGTMFSRDIVYKVFGVKNGETLLRASRFGVMVTVVVSVVFVYFNMNSGVLNWNYLSMALRGSGIFLPLTCCIFFPGKVKPIYGLLSMAAGIFVALGWNLCGHQSIHPIFPAVVGSTIFLILGVLKNK